MGAISPIESNVLPSTRPIPAANGGKNKSRAKPTSRPPLTAGSVPAVEVWLR